MSRSPGPSANCSGYTVPVVSGSSAPCSKLSSRRQAFLEIVQESNNACSNGDYPAAVKLYSRALKIDPNNHVLYSNRSAARIKLGHFAKALQDALKARDLNPKWPKAYYRQGVALQCLGKHADALAAFSAGLAADVKSSQLLSGLIEAALKSPLRGKLEPIFAQLERMKLDKSVFVVISLIGQELLSSGYTSSAAVVLESGLKIGTGNLKLKGSVFSALSSAYWALNSLEKAINYMQQDLEVAKQLFDIAGECRAHGNLGSAYLSKGNFKAALTSHRCQLVLAMKSKDTQATAAALTSLGHVYTGIGDYANSLASHQQCVQLMKQVGDSAQQGREIGNVGSVYLLMGDFESAIDCHTEHLRLVKGLGNRIEEARAYSNLGSAYHYKKSYEKSVSYYHQALQIGLELRDKILESRAYAGLGHAARCSGELSLAKSWYEKQLEVALTTKDKPGEGRALSNMGITYQLLGDQESALKLHQAHLHLVMTLGDRAGIGRAYGNIGNAYSALGYYDQALNYHKQEMGIAKEVNDRNSEGFAHGNLAVAYQALGEIEKALSHYHNYLNISRELKDGSAEACALLNIANCHSSIGDFRRAISFYENYLMVSQELSDVEGESKACHFLGFAHYCLGNFKEAIRYYDQDLSLAKDLGNQENVSRAYCNLGLTHMALSNYDKALECQTNFLTLSHELKNSEAKCRALGNIGNVLLKMKRQEDAVSVYQKQLVLAKAGEKKNFEASAYGSLGIAHRHMKQYERAASYHSHELAVRREMNDVEGECRAYGNLGAVYMSLGSYKKSIDSYQEMLKCAKDLSNYFSMAQAYGNLGIGMMNKGKYNEAITFFEEQLKVFDTLVGDSKTSSVILAERGHAFNNLGDSFAAIGKYKECVQFHEKALSVFTKLEHWGEQEKTVKALGIGHRALGNHGEALKHFEERLALARSGGGEVDALSDLGNQHLELRNFDEALENFQNQLKLSLERGWKKEEILALANIGKSYEQMGNWNEALLHYRMQLNVAMEVNLAVEKSRANGSIGFVHESLGEYDQALLSYEECLTCASQTTDSVAKATALSSIGRIQYLFGNNIQALAYLNESLQMIENLEASEEESKINHFLGLTLWRQDDLESAEGHLLRSIQILENVRATANWPANELSLRLFDREIASYQALQRILVLVGKSDEALIIAETARTIPDLTLRKVSGQMEENCVIKTLDDLLSRINQLRSAVLYFSLVGTVLFSWLLIPGRGIVKFNECSLSGGEDLEDEGGQRKNMDTLLDIYVQGTRDALGIGFPTVEGGEDDPDVQSQLEELGDSLNQANDKSGFLRMVSRNSRFNCSSYSLSSLFSTTGSVKSLGSVSSRSRNHRDRGSERSTIWQGPSCLRSLHQLLIAPFEEELSVLDSTCFKELILVVEPPLLTVPFPLLRSSTSEDYLATKFKLIMSPSLSLSAERPMPNLEQNPTYLVIGNPRVSSRLRQQWGWLDLPKSAVEANLISQILRTEPLIGLAATKQCILAQLPTATVIHFATHVSWKLGAVVVGQDTEVETLSECLLTAGEILKMKLSARVVVLSCYHGNGNVTNGNQEQTESSVLDGECVMRLSKALLASGVSSVLISLWPTSDPASKLFFRSFYSALLQGARVSHALSEAMSTLQQSKNFNHPINWAGYILLGSDCRITRNSILPGQAIWELLKTPENYKDSLRVCLHLIEKSLQRIKNGHKNPMYTTQKSIENKVGDVIGWQEILTCVGFRLEPSANGLPAAVFFPQMDPGERLVKCSTCLQALLGLPPSPIRALSKLLSTPEAEDQVSGILRQAISEMTSKDGETEKIQLKIDVKLWGIVGCHELLAALGFDLIEVGENEVILGVGKNVTLRIVKLALQATLSLFEALRTDVDAGYNSSTFPLDGVELKPEELEIPLETPYTLHSRIPQELGIGMGQGAFTSYIRSRGEPDGLSNLSGNEPRTTQIIMKTTAQSQCHQLTSSLASIITRTDSATSSDHTTSDWENAFNTIRLRRPPPQIPVHVPETTKSESSIPIPMVRSTDSKPTSSDTSRGRIINKRITRKKCTEGTKSSTLVEHVPHLKSDKVNRDMLFGSIFTEQGVGLDLAPPLSKLLMSSRLNLSQVDDPSGRLEECEVDSDDYNRGNQNLDETLSNFDQLSLAEDSAAESNSTKKLRIKARTRTSAKLTLLPPNVTMTSKGSMAPNGSMTSKGGLANGSITSKGSMTSNGSACVATHLFTEVLAPPLPLPLPQTYSRKEVSTTNNSSKGSPEFCERVDGDGRSLTDSQYGSYSPSTAIAQARSDLQSHYFASKNSTLYSRIEPEKSDIWLKDSFRMTNKGPTKDTPNPTSRINLSSCSKSSDEC